MSDNAAEPGPLMPRGGARPGAGRPPTGVRDKVLGFRVKSAELERAEAVRRKGETMSAMARVAWLQEVEGREDGASIPRTRAAIAEIESMIRGCKLTEAKAKGEYLRTTETQRRTLEFVLGLLKPAEVKRRERVMKGGE